ncbi:MAG TPA: uroporphyrinogen decarboxylase [Limnochordia bacterium]
MDRFLRACRGQAVDRTPVWFMRQAGRYQPEYRRLRERYTLYEICRQPELCATVTRLPVEKLGVDAAILFSDITVPLQAIGVPVALKEDVGPIIDPPFRDAAAIKRLRALSAEEDVPYVLDAIRLLRRTLEVPLIGFTGGPFTLASYLVEGGPTRRFIETKRMMYQAPGLWHDLMARLARLAVGFLRAQVCAGAQAVQIFDSWIGALSPEDYRTYVLPHSRAVFAGIADLGVPSIHFGVGTSGLIELMREAGGDVIGIDWTLPLSAAWQRLGDGVALQGNLDPALLLGPPELLERRALALLREVGRRPGHIFNLGHGVLPQTPVSALQRLTDVVHGFEIRESEESKINV